MTVKLDYIAEHIIQVKVPLPFSLRWVNAYLLNGEDGWTIVDPGLRTEQAARTWVEVFAQLHINSGDVAQIVLTHYHPDHLGIAGELQLQFDVPVWLSETGWRHAQMLWDSSQAMAAAMQLLFEEHGAPDEVVQAIGVHMDSFIPLVSPLPQVSFIRDSQQVAFGGRNWNTIETHGHAPGHMSFYDEASRVLIAGDHVLPQISPNVSFMPGSDPEPLHSYMTGLERLLQLKVDLALPGHRHPFSHYSSRIEELLRHHEERLAGIAASLTEPRTAYELCCTWFGSLERLTVHQFRFALGETLAHLIELERRGLARKLRPQCTWQWTMTSGM